MTTYIALLRGVNVGGKTITMESLRELVATVGGVRPETVLTSGNVVCGFSGSGRTLEHRLEDELHRRLGLTTVVLVRTSAAWTRILDRNPHEREARVDPSHLVIVALKSPVTATQVTQLQSQITGPERVAGDGTEVFVAYPDGIGRSPLTLDRIERSFGTRGTARNWNTAVRLGRVAVAHRSAG